MPSELPARFARNAVSNYALAAVLLAVALVTTPVLTHHLGPQRYGIWVFVGTTIAYVQLLDLGFGGAVVSAVARLSAAGDDGELERTLNSALCLLIGMGLLALGVAALGAAFLPGAIHLHGALAATTRDLLLLLGLDMALSIPMDTFGCGLVALQRYDLLNSTLMAVALGQAVAWVVVLTTGGGLLLLGVVTVAISLCGQVVRFVLLRRLLPDLSIAPQRVERRLVRALASPAGWYALGDSIDGFRDNASVLILGIVQNVASAGIFAVGEKLATLGTTLGNPLSDPYFPHAAALVGRGEEDQLGKAARTGSLITAGVTIPCCVVAAVFAHPAVIAWVGPAYRRAVPAVVILAVAFGVRSLIMAPLKIAAGSGGQKTVALLGVAKIAAQVTLTAVLGLSFGVTGVAWAIFASVVGLDLAVTLPLLCRRLGTRVVGVVAPVVRGHVLPVAAAGTLGWFLARGPVGRFADAHGRLAGVGVVALAGLGTLALYGVVFAVTGLDRRARRRAVLRLRTVARRRAPQGPGHRQEVGASR